MFKALTTIILLSTFAFAWSTPDNKSEMGVLHSDSIKKAYTDSIFFKRLQSESLTDSTLRDKLYYHFYNGLTKMYAHADASRAIDEFSTCMQNSSPKNFPDIYAASSYQIFNILQAAKSYDQAYKFLNIAYNTQPRNPKYLENLAWFEYARNNNKKSLSLFKKLNKLYPSNTKYINGLSQAYLQNGEYQKALKEIDKCIKLDGHSLQILSERAEILYTAKKYEQAINEINQYANDNPAEWLEAKYILSQFYTLINEDSKALEMLLLLNRHEPNNSTILLAMADYYKKNSNDSLQNICTLKAIYSHTIPANAVPNIIRPTLANYTQNGLANEAKNILDTLKQIYPNELPIIELTASTYEALKDTTQWLKTLYEISLISNNEKNDMQIIDLELKNNNYKQVRRITNIGYRKYKKDSWAYYKLIGYGLDELYDSMLIVADSIIPTVTNNNIRSLIFQSLGDTYSNLKNDSLAMIMYDSCLHYNPQNAGALNNKAYNLTKKDKTNLKEAERLASKALELDPENISTLDTYAWILLLRGDYVLSKIYFDKLQRIEQEQQIEPSVEVLYHRGVLCLKQSDKECTKQFFTEALKMYKKDYLDKNEEISEPEIINEMTLWLENND